MEKVKFAEKTNRSKSDDLFTARAVIQLNGRLLVHSHLEKFGTYITLGGHVHKGESLWEGLCRELQEEAGITVTGKERDPDFVYMRNHYYVLSPKEIEMGGERTHTDGGKLALVTWDEMLQANEKSIAVPIIHSDYEALTRLLKS